MEVRRLKNDLQGLDAGAFSSVVLLRYIDLVGEWPPTVTSHCVAMGMLPHGIG